MQQVVPETGPTCFAVAYSGGRDSTALLYACARVAQSVGAEVVALHVHHGLSAHADAWLQHARTQCEAWAAQGLPVRLCADKLALNVPVGDSLEAVAREARYEALARMARGAGADLVMLAHHRQDQAETFLLQAMRGAGVAGLAAMPERIERDGVVWCRPWLDRERSEIESYVAAHGLSYIDDDSNADQRFARNRLRLSVMPVWRSQFPQVDQALAHAAQHSADAAWCLARWADAELRSLSVGALALDATAWMARPAPERRELLRHWVQQVAGQSLSRAWVYRLCDEVPTALMAGRQAHWPEVSLGLYRGELSWYGADAQPLPAQGMRPQAPSGAAVRLNVSGPGAYSVPEWAGVLQVSEAAPDQPGVPWSSLAEVRLLPRSGGESFQIAANRPARCLKKQFQSRGVPAWLRHAPLVYSQNRLLFVPALGMDARATVIDPAQSRAHLTWLSLPAETSKG